MPTDRWHEEWQDQRTDETIEGELEMQRRTENMEWRTLGHDTYLDSKSSLANATITENGYSPAIHFWVDEEEKEE